MAGASQTSSPSSSRSATLDLPHSSPSAGSIGSPGPANRSGPKLPAVEPHIVRHDPQGPSLLQHLFGHGGKLLETADGLTGRAEKIAGCLKKASGVAIAHLPPGGAHRVLRKGRIVVAKIGKVAGKIGSGTDTLQTLNKLSQNVQTSYPKMVRIIRSDESWPDKSARLNCELAALLLKTIAQTGLGPVHELAQNSRTGAAMLGFDVSHPTFGERPAYDPRTFLSWQAINFFESRLDYNSEVIFDGDTIYMFLHAHVRHG
jgi:hypothetical protein